MEPHRIRIPLGLTGFLPQPGWEQATRHFPICTVFSDVLSVREPVTELKKKIITIEAVISMKTNKTLTK
jgi:hypothetical protein